MGLADRADTTKDEILRSDSYTVPVAKRSRFVDGDAVHFYAVAAAHVLNTATIFANEDARVLPGDERILDRQVAVEAPPDHRDASRQIELLEEKPKPVARHLLFHPRERVRCAGSSAPVRPNGL